MPRLGVFVTYEIKHVNYPFRRADRGFPYL